MQINFENIEIKKEKTGLFKIEFCTPNILFINSLTKTNLIIGASISDDYKLIKFTANSIEPINKTKLTISEAANLFENLARQLSYLIDNNHTLIGFHIKNIILINNNTFVNIGGCEFIKEINENDKIEITSPFSENDFCLSPELKKITSLPSSINYKTCFFSLAYLVIINLTNELLIYQENPINLLDKHLIKNTKLYWLLERCLNKDPLKRTLLFI